jgi:phosphoglycerate dehydrogenase-like enzyme
MHDDGGLSRGGIKIKSEEAKPEAAFACSDLYNRGPVRDFMILLLKSDRIRWVQSGAAGFDNPVFGLLAEKGIRLTRSNAAAVAISEFVIASVLHFLHPFQKRRESQEKKAWVRHEFQELSGKIWLIIGLGNIGQEIALRVSAFGCPVIGVRRRPVGNEPAAKVITPDRTGEFLPEADVIVLSAALNTTTDHLVDRSFLQALKPSSILVNIARGSMIDEKALLESLDRGKPQFAILDVFESEPLPKESPLWSHPRVQVTAHSSAFTPEKQARGDRVFLENLKLYRAGKALHFEVSKSEFKK